MRKRIGEFLLEKGVVTQPQVLEILKYSRDSGLRFGEAGLEMGLITREKMVEVFGPSFSIDFFYIDTEYFPKATRELLPVETMIRLGALPLGFKTERKFFSSRKVLNLGLLDPAAKGDVTAEILRMASSRAGDETIQGVKIYLILADQFIEVMQAVYGLSEDKLRSAAAGGMDSTLSMFLEPTSKTPEC